MANFNFDEQSDEFDTGENEQPVDQAQEVINDLEQENEQLDEDLTEVESRLEVASYYSCLLKDSLFGQDTSNASRIVTHRIKKFVREELSELVGLTQPKALHPAQPLFTDGEIAALKALAAKVMGKPAIIESAPKRGPQLNTVSVPQKVLPTINSKPPVIPTVTPKTIPPQSKQQPKIVKRQQGKGKRFVEIPHPMIPGETIKKDVSSQIQPMGAIRPLPMPQGQMMTQALEQQAQIISMNPLLANSDKLPEAGKIKNQIATAINLSLKE